MYVTISDARIFVDVVGPGLDLAGPGVAEKPTLLMLHGGPGADHTTLRPHFDRFADIAQVVYMDHRGCGRSGGAPETWRLDQWADDVARICAELGIVRPIVFGQSFGGMVAMHFAARHPDALSRLILSSTAARFRLQDTIDMATRLGGDHVGAVARRFFSDPSLEGYREYEAVCLPLYTRTAPATGGSYRDRAIERPEVTVHFFRQEMMDMDLRPGIAAIPCPTLVLAGAMDPVTPTICSEDIARAIGDNARLEVFADCGHGVHRDDPEGSEKVMRQFILAP